MGSGTCFGKAVLGSGSFFVKVILPSGTFDFPEIIPRIYFEVMVRVNSPLRSVLGVHRGLGVQLGLC